MGIPKILNVSIITICTILLSPSTNTAQIFTGTNGALSDNNCGGTFNTFTANVSGVGPTDVIENVTLNISHTWVSEVQLFLVSPTGQILELSTGNGGGFDNYTNTIFTDNAPQYITSGSAPFTGSYKPEGRYNDDDLCNPPGTLGTFTFESQFWGNNPNGIWELKIKDSGPGDIGTLNSWSITIGPPPILAKVGINTNNPESTLDVDGKIKIGNDGLPALPGMIRYYATENDFEGYDGTMWRSFTSGNIAAPHRIQDTDNNTSVDVETNTNENIIRFVLNANENFTFYPTRFHINTGDNTFIGKSAGINNTSGQFNTSLGENTLSSNTSGSFNTALGTGALVTNTVGGSNAAFGYSALFFNTTGSFNTAIGRNTMGLNTTGSNNSALGRRALFSNTTGNDNAAFGHEALYSNSTANSNSAFGSSSLKNTTTGSVNSAFGFEALISNTTGSVNAAFGAGALSSNTTGGENSAFGNQALGFNLTGNYNSAFGRSSLLSNTSGVSNCAFGLDALQSNISGHLNSAFGTQTLYNNTTGEDNSALGASALLYNTTGSNNIAIGKNSGRYDINNSLNQTSNNSIYIGVDARASSNGNTNEIVIGNNANGSGSNTITIGNNQTTITNLRGTVAYFPIGTNPGETGQVKFYELTANGNNAVTLKSPDNLSGNVNLTLPENSGTLGQVLSTNGSGILSWINAGGNGGNGLVHPTTGSTFESGTNDPNIVGINNTVIGYGAGINIVDGDFNTAFGYNSLNQLDFGINNTAFGYNALSETTYSANSAFGSEALTNHFAGTGNSAFGWQALHNQVNGDDNTAFGIKALFANQQSNFNSAFGAEALRSNTTGIRNCAIGERALDDNTSGGFNTALGASSFLNSNNNYFQSIAIGWTSPITASYQARIGNANTTSIGGYEPWTNLSDLRFKKHIENNALGLEFIKKLNPVTYKIDVAKLNDFLNIPDSLRDTEAELTKSQQVRHGFLAQEVEQAATSLGFDFNGVDKPKNDSDHYGLRYSLFVVPLVKAVQEQQAMIEDLKTEIELLKEQNALQMEWIKKLKD